MSKKRIVVILGMHRSGTSAMARGLKALNVELGDNLLPPVANNNERGFWEDQDIYRLNERLLAKAGNGWDRLSAIDSGLLIRDEFAAERREATQLLEQKLAASPLFGFKDPRTSVLLPFWKCVFEDLELDESYLIAVRNPYEVAESLGKRDRFDADFGIGLWLKYSWAAIIHSTGKRRIAVGYPRLIDDPALQLARLSAAFNLPLPARASPEYMEYAAEFLSRDLRHNRVSDKEVFRSQSIPGVVADLYQVLLNWCDAPPGEDLEIPQKLKTKIDAYLAQSQFLLALTDRLKISADTQTAKATAAEKSRLELKVYAEQLQGRLADREKIISELKSASDEALRDKLESKAAAETLAAKLEAAESRIAALESIHEAIGRSEALAVAAAQQTAQRLDSLQKLHDDFVVGAQASQAAASGKIAELEAASRQLRASLEDRDHQLSEASAALLSVQGELDKALGQLALVTQNWQATQQKLSDALAAVEVERASASKSIAKAEAKLSSAIEAEREQSRRREEELKAAFANTESSISQLLAEERKRTSQLTSDLESAHIEFEHRLNSAITAERDRASELEQTLKAAQLDSETRLGQLLAEESARAQQLEATLLSSRQEAAATLVAALSEEANRVSQIEASLKAALEDQRDQTRRLTLDLKSAKLDADSAIASLEEKLREALDRKETAEAEVRKVAAMLKSKEVSSAEELENALSQRLNAASAALTEQYEARISALKLELSEKARTSRLLRRDMLEIQASTSWRVTKPLRAVGNWLTSFRRTSKENLGSMAGHSSGGDE